MTVRRDRVVNLLLVVLSVFALTSLSLAVWALVLEHDASQSFTTAQVTRLRGEIDAEITSRAAARDVKEAAQAAKSAKIACDILSALPRSSATDRARVEIHCDQFTERATTATPNPSATAGSVSPHPSPAVATTPRPSRTVVVSSPAPVPPASPTPSPPSPSPTCLITVLGACL